MSSYFKIQLLVTTSKGLRRSMNASMTIIERRYEIILQMRTQSQIYLRSGSAR